MAKNEKGPARIAVVGDLAVDWNIAQTDARLPWERGIWMNPAPGGAWLLADLIAAMARGGDGTVLVDSPTRPRTFNARSTAYVNSHLLLRQFEVEKRIDGQKKKVRLWKASELLGYTRFDGAGERPEPGDKADVVVIDDANFGYRSRKGKDGKTALPAALKSKPRWVLYKMAGPLESGRLWQAALDSAERLVAVVNVDDLRATGSQISQGISWEKTCEETAWALHFHPALSFLSQCQCVVVHFPFTAAFVYQKAPGGEDGVHCNLVFDPTMMEGQWVSAQKGTMVGATAALSSAIATELANRPEAPVFPEAALRGLATGRALHTTGYQPSGKQGIRLRFPIDQAVAEERSLRKGLASAALPLPWSPDFKKDWTILNSVYGSEPLTEIAKTILVKGLEAGLSGVPVATFKYLQTVDRGEIEGYNAIRNLVNEYLNSSNTKPLSIGVFGPPGSGKSFGISQIAEALSEDIKDVEFNLSQFNKPAELNSALHVVRDIALKGKVPLVFWDEFDSSRGADEKLFWLKYFLMPMQDGKFREGELEHPIGRAIFVFAGGTSATFSQFCERDSEEERNAFKAVKGPDFVSRLKGHIDIMGPNPREFDDGTVDPSDRFYPVRRAIVLRSLFMRGFKQLNKGGTLDIEESVCNAFIEVPKFKHGVRSMESVIRMSTIGNKTRYESSALPTAKQLSGHVDADEFNRILVRPRLPGELVEKLAIAIHACYQQTTATDVATKEFEDLTPDLQESNRQHARFLFERLARARCAIRPMRGVETRLPLTAENQELLAIQEHERFNAERFGARWTAGYPKDVDARVSPYLVDWDDLPEGIKQYDRNFISALPRVLALFGYQLEPLDGWPPEEEATPLQRVVRIGVVGHRAIKLSVKLKDGIAAALKAIRKESAKGSSFAVATPLAEGSDQLGADMAMELLGASLAAVLPMPLDEYLDTFDSDEGRDGARRLLSRASHCPGLPPVAGKLATLAFQQAGEWVVDDCDYLVAVWDGTEGMGQGSTAGAVAYARGKAKKEHKKLFIIDPASGKLTREP